MANKFMFSYFYVVALCDLGFTLCGSYTEQLWPPLAYNMIQISIVKIHEVVLQLITQSHLSTAQW